MVESIEEESVSMMSQKIWFSDVCRVEDAFCNGRRNVLNFFTAQIRKQVQSDKPNNPVDNFKETFFVPLKAIFKRFFFFLNL